MFTSAGLAETSEAGCRNTTRISTTRSAAAALELNMATSFAMAILLNVHRTGSRFWKKAQVLHSAGAQNTTLHSTLSNNTRCN